MRRHAAAFLLAAALAACSSVPATPPAGIVADDAPEIAARPAYYDLGDVTAASGKGLPQMWLMEKDGHTLAVFGTMHAVPAGVRWLAPEVKRAFAAADLVLTEVGTTDAAQYNPRMSDLEGLAGLLNRSDGIDSRDLIGPRGTPARAELDLAIEMVGLNTANIGLQQAWTLCLDLQHGETAESLGRLSADERARRIAAVRAAGEIETGAYSPDARIERFRLSQGLAHKQLETFATRARAYATMPEADALACMRARARAVVTGEDFALFPQRFRSAYEHWMRGDIDAARRSETAESDRIAPGFSARLYQARERQWLSLIAERCDAAGIDCAIAVGFAHLGGADGLLKGLERMGYRRVKGGS